MISGILFPIGVGLLLLSCAFFVLMLNEQRFQEKRLERAHQQELNIPWGELVYEDADGQGERLNSDDYPLVGKPTYVVKLADGRLMPVEVLHTPINGMNPASNHVLQMAAYCLILEDYSDAPPTHGVIRYSDREFTVEYTTSLRKKVIRTLEAMSVCSPQHPPELQKQKVSKCRACLFQPICPVGQGK